MGRRLLNGCLVLMAAFVCPFTVIVSVAGASLVFGMIEGPSAVDVDVRSPATAIVDESFSVDVFVTNEADTVQTLDDIELNTLAIGVIELISTSPPFSDSIRDPFNQAYWFEEEIQPGETQKVSLEVIVRQKGTHPFQLGVCINVSFRCLYYDTEIVGR